MGNQLEKLQCYKIADKKVSSLLCKKQKVTPLVIQSGHAVATTSGEGIEGESGGKVVERMGGGGEGGDIGGSGGGQNKMMKLPPEIKQLMQSGLFSDKDRVIQIIRKLREMMSHQDTIRYYEENLDPSKPDVLLNLKRLWVALDRQVLIELELDSYITDWTNFPGLLPPIFALYFKDAEVIQEMEHITPIPRPDVLKKGHGAPDVGVISLITGEILELSRFNAIIMGGALSELFRDYHEQADFLCVYMAEAHPQDRWDLGSTFSFMTEHQTLDQRMSVARELLSKDAEQYHSLTADPMDCTRIPLVVDTMENTFCETYNAHPDRVYVIEGGVLVYVGDGVMEQMRTPERFLTHELRDWFEQRFRLRNHQQ